MPSGTTKIQSTKLHNYLLIKLHNQNQLPPTRPSYAYMSLPRQTQNGIRPSPRRMIATIRRRLSFGSRLPNHPQNFPHTWPVLRSNCHTSHRNVQKSPEFLLGPLVARTGLIGRLGLFLSDRADPSRNVRAVVLNEVPEGGLAGEELQEEDTKAVYVSLLGGWGMGVATLGGSVEEGGGGDG